GMLACPGSSRAGRTRSPSGSSASPWAFRASDRSRPGSRSPSLAHRAVLCVEGGVMLLLTCPFCRWPLLLPDHRLGLTHRCVNCNEEYDTSKVSDAAQLSLTTSRTILPNVGVSPRRATATAQEKPKTPATAGGLLSQLTSPHSCQHCEGALEA